MHRISHTSHSLRRQFRIKKKWLDVIPLLYVLHLSRLVLSELNNHETHTKWSSTSISIAVNEIGKYKCNGFTLKMNYFCQLFIGIFVCVRAKNHIFFGIIDNQQTYRARFSLNGIFLLFVGQRTCRRYVKRQQYIGKSCSRTLQSAKRYSFRRQRMENDSNEKTVRENVSVKRHSLKWVNEHLHVEWACGQEATKWLMF